MNDDNVNDDDDFQRSSLFHLKDHIMIYFASFSTYCPQVLFIMVIEFPSTSEMHSERATNEISTFHIQRTFAQRDPAGREIRL